MFASCFHRACATKEPVRFELHRGYNRKTSSIDSKTSFLKTSFRLAVLLWLPLVLCGFVWGLAVVLPNDFFLTASSYLLFFRAMSWSFSLSRTIFPFSWSSSCSFFAAVVAVYPYSVLSSESCLFLDVQSELAAALFGKYLHHQMKSHCVQ